MRINQLHTFSIQWLRLLLNFLFIHCDSPLYSIVSPTSLFLKAAEALLKSFRSRSLLGLDRWPNRDPQTKTGPKTPLDLDGPAVALRKHHNTISALICEAFSCS